MIIIPQTIYQRIVASSSSSEEQCGFLMGRGDNILESHPVKNVSHKKNHFTMSFFGKMMAVTNFFHKKYDLMIIYHTHPTEEKISLFDVIQAFNFDQFHGIRILYLVVSSKSVNIFKMSNRNKNKRVQQEEFEVR